MKTRLPMMLLSVLVLVSGCTVYQSIGKSVGSFLHPVAGHDFVHIGNDQWNQDNALIYFYRTHSQWAADEEEAEAATEDEEYLYLYY